MLGSRGTQSCSPGSTAAFRGPQLPALTKQPKKAEGNPQSRAPRGPALHCGAKGAACCVSSGRRAALQLRPDPPRGQLSASTSTGGPSWVGLCANTDERGSQQPPAGTAAAPTQADTRVNLLGARKLPAGSCPQTEQQQKKKKLMIWAFSLINRQTG